MANAERDQNHVHTLIAPHKVTPSVIVKIKVNPSNHGLSIEDNTTGSDNGSGTTRDDNNVPVLMGVSEADGTTPIVIYGTTGGALTVDSN